MKWSLSALLGGAQRIESNRSNTPCVRDIQSMLDEFRSWKEYYGREAKRARERHAKLELIGDKDAYWEKHSRDNAERDEARCDVGIRALTWAIEELSK